MLSKYLSAMICLVLPVLISFLLALMLQLQSPVIDYSTADFLRIGGIFINHYRLCLRLLPYWSPRFMHRSPHSDITD